MSKENLIRKEESEKVIWWSNSNLTYRCIFCTRPCVNWLLCKLIILLNSSMRKLWLFGLHKSWVKHTGSYKLHAVWFHGHQSHELLNGWSPWNCVTNGLQNWTEWPRLGLRKGYERSQVTCTGGTWWSWDSSAAGTAPRPVLLLTMPSRGLPCWQEPYVHLFHYPFIWHRHWNSLFSLPFTLEQRGG